MVDDEVAVVVGRKYHVFWNDCCTNGEFIAILLEIEDPKYYYTSFCRFDNGVKGRGFDFEELDDGETLQP